MSSEWSSVSLAEAGEVFTGFPFKGDAYLPPRTGVRVVRGDNVTEHSLRWGDKEKCWAAVTNDLEPYRLAIGDVVIGMDGSKVGKNFAAVTQADGECILAQRVARVRAKPHFDQAYLRYSICSDVFTNYVQAVHTGTSIPHISKGQIERFPIYYPPLHHQRRIGSFLKSLDDRIALLRETNATLEAIAQALFKSWFVDFDPVHAKLQGRAPEGLDESTAALFPDSFEESELGLVPRGWRVVTIGDVSTNHSTTFDFSSVEKVIFINTGDVSEGQFLHGNYSDKENLPGQAKKSIEENDILFSEIRPKNRRFAYVGFNPKNYVVSTKFMVLRAISGMHPKYLYQVLRQPETIGYFNTIAESRSGTFPQITFDSIKGFRLIKPSNACLERYVEFALPLFEKIELLNQQIKTIATLRDNLLPHLISGQLRLPEAEAMLAAA